MNTAELRRHLAGAGGAALFDLRERVRFALTGADRVRYLNGQVSQDVRRLDPGENGAALPACVTNAKGKMSGFVWISAGPETLWIDADPGSSQGDQGAFREAFAARLERYIVADDVTLTDTTETMGLFHLLGVARERLGPLPEGVECRRSARYGLDGIDGLDLLGPGDALEAFDWPKGILRVGGIGSAVEEAFRIEQGIPRWGAELDENTLPAEAGLDAAIDFHKGCYIGQEVISRIKSVGHVNRRLCGFVAAEPLRAGTTLRCGEREAGVLTSAAWSFALDKAVALGYLRRGIDAPRLVAASTEVEVRPLPLIAAL